ncbi:hypothetical protein O3S81_20255 [Agrobacterium sp. SOY23]|uniref:hypothetical protein n=1 Tax=Agrobacterium sp. SOY23 TaxID=3014555 RepID=UPI0022AEEDD3|nr:hypothetical protein [Agrobacterium sp. SOY23]MCZ4432046.1 hypothetical protein [Agrobacterium sp. SOY23]
MRRIFAVLLSVIFISGQALAAPRYYPKIWDFSKDVINSSIKCELALAIRAGNYSSIKPDLLKARITTVLESTKSVGTPVGLKFPLFNIGVSGGIDTTDASSRTYRSVFNISAGNFDDCNKRNIFQTGLLDCIRDALNDMNDRQQQDAFVSCKRTITVKYTGAASATAPVWLITSGPSTTGSNQVSHSITAVVPASRVSGLQ